MYELMRPLLFRLDSERAHEYALRTASMLARRRRLAGVVRRVVARPAADRVRLMGLDFPHRVGLAAGFDKNAVAPLAWWALGFGFIELGTVTPLPQPGHPKPRMFRFPAMHALVNRMGFNNHGADAIAARLAAQERTGLRPALPIGISVGKNAITSAEAATMDYVAAARTLAPHADFISMNISSPNTPGLRNLQSSDAAGLLVAAVKAVTGAKPVLVKVAPELEGAALEGCVQSCLTAGAAGIIATNTLSTIGRQDLPEGGLSGQPLRDVSRRRVEQIRRTMGSAGVLIGCGGIDDMASARAMLDAGADLIQLYTGLIYRGPFLAARLSRAGLMRREPASPP